MTSKEQAEEQATVIFNQVVQRFDSECMAKLPDYREELYQMMLQSIPLTELLEVAKAASGLAMGSDWNNGTHAKHHGYRDKLINALSALRATGKVTL